MPRRGSKEGSISKRRNGTWAAALQVEGKRKTVYAATRKEVQEKLQDLQKKARSGRFVRKGSGALPVDTTVREFLQHWLSLAKPNVRPSTWEHYSLCVR